MMKIEKIKENSIDEILDFTSSNKNLIIGNSNNFSNDFKNLLKRFASTRSKTGSEILCYVLRNEKNELQASIVFDCKGEISAFCLKDSSNFICGKVLIENLVKIIDTKKIPSLTAKVKDDNIGKFNEIGFKNVSFEWTMDDGNTYSNYYFLIRYDFENVTRTKSL